MNLYEKLLKYSEEDYMSQGEVYLNIKTTHKPNVGYMVSRLDPSDVNNEEWLKNNGVYDDLSLNISGRIERPASLAGVDCSVSIESPINWGETNYKEESALGWGFDNGDNGLDFNIIINTNIQKNIIEKIYWIDKILNEKEDEEIEKDVSFTIVIKNLKKLENKSVLGGQFLFTVERIYF